MITNKMNMKITKDGIEYIPMLTENFLMKLALNAASLNKEIKKNIPYKISKTSIIDALP